METSVYEQFYRLEKEHWWFAGMRTLCRSLLEQEVIVKHELKRCLDIGCGTGLWTKELQAFGRVHGLDVSPEALRFCRKRGVDRLVFANAEQLPFRAESYDLITALGLIEHLDDDVGFLSELSRVCKPGGFALFLTSAYPSLWSQHDEIVHHRRRYTVSDLKRLLASSGFQVIRSTYINTFLLVPILGFRMFQRIGIASRDASNGSPDVFMPPRPLNKLLYGILWAETRLLSIFDFPFGVGLLAIARKAGN